MPISDTAATELAQLLGSGTAGELIPELVRQGLQALIEAEAAAALGADRHQRTDHPFRPCRMARSPAAFMGVGAAVQPNPAPPERR